MSVGVRQLAVLGEFKPFGLVAEALDGKPPDNTTDDYDYFLFDPENARQRDEDLDYDSLASALSDRCDHELFIRGNRIIWSVGSRVIKRFTLPSPVIMACWCRFGDISEALLCVLLKDSLTVYKISGRIKLNVLTSDFEGSIGRTRVKLQHSVWVAEVINSSLEVENASLSATVPAAVLPKRFCFRRIWQWKGAHIAASKVFLATDDDAAPIICFLLLEQKKLLSLRLQTVEINNEILFDVKPDMSWSIPAIVAAPVIVTRPSVKVGPLPYTDIVVLAPENILYLYMFRCALRKSPSSSLANDCITAMAEGLSPDSYGLFLAHLWGNGDICYLSEANSTVDSEWNSFCYIIMQICKKSSTASQKIPKSSWEFLCNSKFHENYCKNNSTIGLSSRIALDRPGLDSTRSYIDGTKSSEKSDYSDLLMESLDSLHAVYESLKMDNLRR
ncbi:Anaphase-promoting complex subunit 1, partial [Corchorus olitorius]